MGPARMGWACTWECWGLPGRSWGLPASIDSQLVHFSIMCQKFHSLSRYLIVLEPASQCQSQWFSSSSCVENFEAQHQASCASEPVVTILDFENIYISQYYDYITQLHCGILWHVPMFMWPWSKSQDLNQNYVTLIKSCDLDQNCHDPFPELSPTWLSAPCHTRVYSNTPPLCSTGCADQSWPHLTLFYAPPRSHPRSWPEPLSEQEVITSQRTSAILSHVAIKWWSHNHMSGRPPVRVQAQLSLIRPR